jgi:hypothetical protein
MLVIAKPSKLPICTRGRVARVTTEGVVPGLEHEWPHTSSTPPGCWWVRVGLVQHVNSLMHEGVSVNLINNMSYELNTCDVGFSTNCRLRNIQQQGETWDETKLHILEIEIMTDTPISLTYVHSLYLEPWNGNANYDQTSFLSHSCGTTTPGFALTLPYLMLAVPTLSCKGEVAHPEVYCNGLLPSLMLNRWGAAYHI